MEDITPFLPGGTVAYLRLADSDRRFPFRPVCSGLFLIGQGPSCDLRLGMKDIPSIHSVLQVDASVAEIVRVAEEPPLIVNGESVERCELQHGDLIEIGDVRLAFFLCHPSAVLALEQPHPSENAAELSASLLLEGVESELALVDPDAANRERIQELLRSAQKAVDACQFAQTIRFADYAARENSANSARPSTDEIILARLTAQQNRMDEICEVLEQVVKQQQLIATALQCVVDRLEDLRATSQPAAFRASA